MIFDILEQKMVDQLGLVTGSTVFRNHMPAETSVGVMIRPPLSGIVVDPNIPCFFKTKMQFITRHTEVVAGIELAQSVADALTVEVRENYPANAERGEAHITLFYPETLPIQFPRLDGNGIEFSQHFTAAFGFTPK